MEHNDLDNLFRKIIQDDDSSLTMEEESSRDEIWEQLDLPTDNKEVIFPFWKVAAGILFLLFGGTVWILQSKIIHETAKYEGLEKEYKELKNMMVVLEKDLEDVENSVVVENPTTTLENPYTLINTVIEKEFIEKIVTVKDTIWLEKNIPLKKEIQLIRDTIYIEVPASSQARWTRQEIEKQGKKEGVTNKKIPSKVEFVFGNKTLKKPEQTRSIFQPKVEVAKKTKLKNKKNLIFSIPDNN